VRKDRKKKKQKKKEKKKKETEDKIVKQEGKNITNVAHPFDTLTFAWPFLMKNK
jgi:hypothetical protein